MKFPLVLLVEMAGAAFGSFPAARESESIPRHRQALKQRSDPGSTNAFAAADWEADEKVDSSLRHEISSHEYAVRFVKEESLSSASPSNSSVAADTISNETSEAIEEEMLHTDAVLFPSFCIVIGGFVFYVLSRVKFLAHGLPYTAAMFLIGMAMGIGTTLVSNTDNRLHQSVQAWTSIDSEVLLLVFLPGLIFKDSIGLSVHMFRVSLIQNFVFAFPMVLAGTSLTALVAYFLFPYNWSFDLCMTFGSILSATDPVAVAALLSEVGAPPRLKTHISGEALLNDGSAIVFYSIFVLRYLYEFGIAGVGEEVDFAHGVALFFRKSLGGVAIGLFFGLAICLMLKLFDRRFNREENIAEVSVVLGVVYANYFMADYVWATSGVIATVVAGLTVKLFGNSMLNDGKLLDDFWSLLEHVLNTVIFTLGGVVWGNVLTEKGSTFNGIEWAYLILLYVMLTLIRTLLFAAVYPFTKNVGLGTCWQETVFQIHAGLRGAVGIALALSLDSQVNHISAGGEVDPIYQDQTRKVFGFVGGIAFITLVFNAPTCKPLLRYLKLSESTETRRKLLEAYRARMRRHAIEEMVGLLSQPRFSYVSFSVIQSHVSFLSDLTKSQLMDAVAKHRAMTPDEEYVEPHLGGILPYIVDDTDDGMLRRDILARDNAIDEAAAESVVDKVVEVPSDVQEFRVLFLDLLRSAYAMQIAEGELVQRQFLTVTLEQSLDLAHDQVSRGEPLKDWSYAQLVDPAVINLDRKIKGNPAIFKCLEALRPGIRNNWKESSKRFNTERALAFMAAHRYAQDFFRKEFESEENELSAASKTVVEESQEEFQMAESVLKKQGPTDLERSVSHKFCSILLTRVMIHIGTLVEQGLLRDEEAESWVKEVEVEHADVNACFRAHGIRSRQCSTRSRKSNSVAGKGSQHGSFFGSP